MVIAVKIILLKITILNNKFHSISRHVYPFRHTQKSQLAFTSWLLNRTAIRNLFSIYRVLIANHTAMLLKQ